MLHSSIVVIDAGEVRGRSCIRDKLCCHVCGVIKREQESLDEILRQLVAPSLVLAVLDSQVSSKRVRRQGAQVNDDTGLVLITVDCVVK